MLHALAARLARRPASPLAAVAAILLAIAPAPPARAAADGPDFWVVHGVPKGDTLSIRIGPSTATPIIQRLPNGYVLRNLGCIPKPQRWCQVQAPNGSFTGWAFGQFLKESAGPGHGPGFPPALPPGFPPGPEVPQVVPRPNGELEVRWRNGCVVLFDRFGNRISAGGSCTRAHKDQSAEAVRRYLNEQGWRPGTGGGAVAVGQMAAYCLGEAAGHFRVKPGALRTNPAFANGRGHSVIGWFAQQPSRGFRCEFRQNGTFAGVFE